MKDFPLMSLENVPFYKKGEYWLPPLNFAPEVQAGYPKKAQIHDVTLRDGEQAAGCTFLEDERVRIAECLDDIGVSRMEAGMPAVSDIQFRALKRIAHAGFNAKIFGFARAMEKDVQLTIDAGCEGIIIEHTVNPYFCKYAYNLTPETMVERLVTSIKTAKKHGLYTTFMGWDWFRTPMDFTKWLITEVMNQAELDGLTVVDTYGSIIPDAVYHMVKSFKEWFPQLHLEFHGHNDVACGNACGLAALKAGAEVIHTSMNSLGDRAGNVSTDEFMVVAQMLTGIDLGAKLENIYANAQIISQISKVPIPAAKPIIGERPYQVESGVTTHLIHSLGDIGIDPITLSFNPDTIGKKGGAEYVLGKNSGKASIQIFLEKHGLTATDDQINTLTDAVKAEGIVTKALVSDVQFLALYKKIVG